MRRIYNMDLDSIIEKIPQVFYETSDYEYLINALNMKIEKQLENCMINPADMVIEKTYIVGEGEGDDAIARIKTLLPSTITKILENHNKTDIMIRVKLHSSTNIDYNSNKNIVCYYIKRDQTFVNPLKIGGKQRSKRRERTRKHKKLHKKTQKHKKRRMQKKRKTKKQRRSH